MMSTFDDRWNKLHEEFERQERTGRRAAWIVVPIWLAFVVAFYGAIIFAMWIGVKWLLENVV